MSAALLWYRRDLRVADNPALQALLQDGHTPVPVYIHDEPDPDWQTGAASAWWLHHSLLALKHTLQRLGSDLLVVEGSAAEQLSRLAKQSGAEAVYWNRCYEPAFVERDKLLKEQLRSGGIAAHSYSANLLREPWQHLKKDDTPYRVFTPFWKALDRIGPARSPVATPDQLSALPHGIAAQELTVESLQLLPTINWDTEFYNHWQPGEDGAWKTLETFCRDHLMDYAADRDFPELSATSRLSAHLHFGEISPVQLWQYLQQLALTETTEGLLGAVQSWLRQLGWREFSQHLLYHFPHTPLEPLDQRFAHFPLA